MVRRGLGLALVASLAAGLSGCQEPARDPFAGAVHPPSLTVEVHNDNYLYVVIYAVRDGGRVRLGTVTGKSDATLEVSSAQGARDGFRLAVDPVGSLESFVTDIIYVHPGTVVVLDVGSVLSMSSWHLR